MLSVKKTVLTAVITAAFTVGAASLAFFSQDSFANTDTPSANFGSPNILSAEEAEQLNKYFEETFGLTDEKFQALRESVKQEPPYLAYHDYSPQAEVMEQYHQSLKSIRTIFDEAQSDDAIIAARGRSKIAFYKWMAFKGDYQQKFAKEIDQTISNYSQSLHRELTTEERQMHENLFIDKQVNETLAAFGGKVPALVLQDPSFQKLISQNDLLILTVDGGGYSDCTPNTKLWENFTTDSGENLLIFSCTMPKAAAQFQAIAPEPKTGLSSLFQSAEEELQTQAAQEVKTANLVLIFAMSKVDSSAFTPQNIYLHVIFAQGGGSNVELDLSLLQAIYANQQLLPAVASNEASKSSLLQELVTAYQEVQANRSQNPNSVQ